MGEQFPCTLFQGRRSDNFGGGGAGVNRLTLDRYRRVIKRVLNYI